MTSEITPEIIRTRTWLPDGVETPVALDRQIADLVETWSRKWFVGSPLSVGPLLRAPRPAMSWRAIDRGIMLGLAETAALELGAHVAGLSAADRPAADRELLEEVAEECLTDLCGLLAHMAGASRAVEWGVSLQPTSHIALIGDDRRPIMAFAFTANLFARLARAAWPARSPVPLGNAGDALARIPISVSAALGRASLSIAEAETLEIGDVLVLDRAVTDAVPIAIGGVALGSGLCTVVQGAPPLIRIVEPVTRADSQ